MQRTATARSHAVLFADALAVIEERYPAALTLDDVAHEIASSRRQLQRVFAEVGDTTFRACLTDVRMRRAAELLRDGLDPVREIAGSVGYRQPAQFAKAFRRHAGLAPAAYRAARR